MLRDTYGAAVFGIEPSAANCAACRRKAFPVSTAPAAVRRLNRGPRAFRPRDHDRWTLEERQLVPPAHGRCVGPAGTGRTWSWRPAAAFFVPFKKTLDLYLGPNPADTPCLPVSANTLQGLLAETGFGGLVNHYVGSDVLCMIGGAPTVAAPALARDDWRRVLEFFSRWHQDTAFYSHDRKARRRCK